MSKHNIYLARHLTPRPVKIINHTPFIIECPKFPGAVAWTDARGPHFLPPTLVVRTRCGKATHYVLT